jgi:glycine oxidase
VRTGVEVRERTAVERVLLGPERVQGVRLRGGERVPAEAVVVAAGSWSAELVAAAGEPVPVRPVKGQTLRLRDPDGPGLLQRAIRFEGGYVVPRADGRYVLGATVEERGFDVASTAGATYELLRDCRELVPGISELEIEELCVGLRPGTPDNVPAIGRGARDGLVWAAGHFRNGILLAPLTAELVLGVLDAATPADPMLAVCDPARFAAAADDGRAAAQGPARSAPPREAVSL